MEETKIIDQEETKEIIKIEENTTIDEEIVSMDIEDELDAESEEEDLDFGEEESDDSKEDAEIKLPYEDFDADEIKSCLGQSKIKVDLKKEGYENNTFNSNDEYNFSDESILKLMDIVNKVKNNKNVNIYAESPQEIKNIINQIMASKGIGGYSVQANTIRNSISKYIIDQFIKKLENDRIDKELNEMESTIEKAKKELADGVTKTFKESNDKLIESFQNVIDDDSKSEKQKEIARGYICGMQDSYKLTRLIEAVKTMKPFKSIEIEKPQQRIFNLFDSKYENSKFTVRPLADILNILEESNPTEVKNGNLLFMLAFAKFCIINKYDPEVPEEHAFMNHTILNIEAISIYISNKEEYPEYTTDFLKIINDIIAILDEHQTKKAENNKRKINF